eukprot:3361321-Amphidinium_carterae.1
MISRGLRPRGSYSVRQLRATTPEPRQRIRRLQHLQDGEEDVEVEEVDDLTRQEYFVNDGNEYLAEEAARENDIEDKYEQYE